MRRLRARGEGACWSRTESEARRSLRWEPEGLALAGRGWSSWAASVSVVWFVTRGWTRVLRDSRATIIAHRRLDYIAGWRRSMSTAGGSETRPYKGWDTD